MARTTHWGLPNKNGTGKCCLPPARLITKLVHFPPFWSPAFLGTWGPSGDSQQRGTAELRGTRRQTPHRVMGGTGTESQELTVGADVRGGFCVPCWCLRSKNQAGGFAELKNDRALCKGLRICKSTMGPGKVPRVF